jgi:hypothetical protein
VDFRGWADRIEEAPMRDVDRRLALTLGFAAVSGLAMPGSVVARTYAPDFGEEIAPGVRQVHVGSTVSKLSGYARISIIDLVFQPEANTYDPAIQNDIIGHVIDGSLIVRQGETQWAAGSSYGPWTSPKGIKTSYKNVHTEVAVLRIIELSQR